MMLSELINELEKIYAEHGNLPMYVNGGVEGYSKLDDANVVEATNYPYYDLDGLDEKAKILMVGF